MIAAINTGHCNQSVDCIPVIYSKQLKKLGEEGIAVPNKLDAINAASLFLRLKNHQLTINKNETYCLCNWAATDDIANFFVNTSSVLDRYISSGLSANVWDASGLNRDELRCTRVLAWYLNPRGNHGCGDLIIKWLLSHIKPLINKLTYNI